LGRANPFHVVLFAVGVRGEETGRVVRGHLVDAKHFDDLGREGGREDGREGGRGVSRRRDGEGS